MKLLRQNNGNIEEIDVAAGTGMTIFNASLTTAHTIAANDYTQIQLDTITGDTGSWWDAVNKRVIPKEAGYYLCLGRVRIEGNAAAFLSAVRLSGVMLENSSYGTQLVASQGSSVVYCNGTTDYIELWAYTGTLKTIRVPGVTYLSVIGPLC